MSAAFTPGPWTFTEGEYFYVNARVDGKRVFILQRKKSVVSAATAYQEAEEDRIHADCQLIAAAPDLLETLKDAYVYIDNVYLRVRIKAVLAKAEGGAA